MKRGASLLAALLLAGVVASPSSADPTEGRWSLDARDRGDHVQINLRRSWSRAGSHGSWSHTNDMARTEVRGLPSRRDWSGPVSLSLVREAGTLHLQGRMSDGRGSGDFTFEPNPDFVADLRRSGFDEVSDNDLMRLATEGLGRDWIRDVRSLGLHDATLDDLLRLASNDVTPEFVRALAAAGYGGLDVEEVIRLRSNDVTADFIRGLGVRKGWHPSVEEVVRLRNNGLEPAFVSALAPRFGTEDMIRLHNNDVSADYVREFQAIGYESLTADELVRLRNNDVSPTFAKHAQSIHGRVTADELIKLRINGVE